MASEAWHVNEAESPSELQGVFRLGFSGLVLALLGAGVQFLGNSTATAVTGLGLGIIGALTAGLAVVRRPSDNRVLALAALTAGAGVFSMSASWGSVRLLFWVLTLVSAGAAIIVSLSRSARRVVVSGLLLFHFAGVFSAITSPPSTPWMTTQTWVRFFRPHLEFCYVNNAYQFYSPEPGPANILWFCIRGDDDIFRWVKIPGREEVYDPLGIEYYRRLSITERANSNEPFPLGPPAESELRRREALNWIPWHPDAHPSQQFKMPDENSRQFLISYARHVARVYGSGRPGVGVKSIKIYLAQHRLLNQTQYANKVDPYGKDTFLPFFVGDYDAEGHLLNPFDPMLFWIVPITKEPKYDSKTGAPLPNEFEYKNYVTAHAGSDPFETP